jgi:hypothetical protein
MENSLREKIINIIETELNIKFTDEVDYQYSLLDPRIGLKPRDLLHKSSGRNSKSYNTLSTLLLTVDILYPSFAVFFYNS